MAVIGDFSALYKQEMHYLLALPTADSSWAHRDVSSMVFFQVAIYKRCRVLKSISQTSNFSSSTAYGSASDYHSSRNRDGPHNLTILPTAARRPCHKVRPLAVIGRLIITPGILLLLPKGLFATAQSQFSRKLRSHRRKRDGKCDC